jgi:hypothetical protein
MKVLMGSLRPARGSGPKLRLLLPLTTISLDILILNVSLCFFFSLLKSNDFYLSCKIF